MLAVTGIEVSLVSEDRKMITKLLAHTFQLLFTIHYIQCTTSSTYSPIVYLPNCKYLEIGHIRSSFTVPCNDPQNFAVVSNRND